MSVGDGAGGGMVGALFATYPPSEPAMHFLGRFRILTKILAIVALLSGIAGLMAYLGISALAELSEKADQMPTAASRALLAARANQNVIALNRAEFRSALDPRDEDPLAVREMIEAPLKQHQERFEEVSKTVDEKAKALLAETQTLSSDSNSLKLEVGKFLNSVRAA
jgi:predicted PurR-regulated permease PerM